MFYFHTMSDFTVGQGARRKASTAVATVVRHGYERLVVNVDGNEYEWYPAECIPVVIETPTQEEASTMALHTGGTVYSWELCGEADRVTQDCQCSTCAHCREELTPEELATLPFDAASTEEASTMDEDTRTPEEIEEEFQAAYRAYRHDWKLLDDGTLDTVIQCRDCKEIERCDSRDSAIYVMSQGHMSCNV